MSPDDPRHGTPAGYQRHRRDQEQACQPCKGAARAYAAANRSKGGPAVARESAANRARSRALWRLADLHPAQFQALFCHEMEAEGYR